MKIAALVKCSLVDYPDRIAAVVFAPGCNLRCFYCHNQQLINASTAPICTTRQEIRAWLRSRQGVLDAVVVSGGEPTLQPDALGFMNEVKQLGFLVKLDTNGTQPDVLASLIGEGVLDYVAMDIKAPLEKYDEVCGVSVDHSAIDRSIDLLMKGSLDYEFRTTVIPQFTRQDILAIGNRIKGARTYVVQKCRIEQPVHASGPGTCAPVAATPAWCMDLRRHLTGIAENCVVRGFGTGYIPAEQPH